VKDWMMFKSKVNIFKNFLLMSVFSVNLLGLFSSAIPASAVDYLEYPLKSRGGLQYYLDICQYLDNDNLTRCEISYLLTLQQFLQYADSSGINLTITLLVNDTTGAGVDTQITSQNISVVDLKNNLHPTVLINKIEVSLKPGLYDFHLRITDESHHRNGIIEQRLMVRDLSKLFSLSDPCFISSIEKSPENNRFEKYGLTLVPNPIRQYQKDDLHKNIYVYYEMNNMYFDPAVQSTFSSKYRVFDLAGSVMIDHPEEVIFKKSRNTSRIEVIPLEEFKTGSYRLEILISDLKTTEMRSFSRYFWVQSNEPAEGLIIPMSEADAKKYFDQIRYIATPQEQKVYKQLDAKGKQEFLLRFWKSRDTNPATPENEFMIDYFKKLEYVEMNFPNGINSDMGRIYIQYGPPIEIDRKTGSTITNKSVIVWRYTLDGITEFYFVDRTGDGRFVLVHSTNPDEFNNPDWMEDLNR
jgi:GWxTD domain-containing protein